MNTPWPGLVLVLGSMACGSSRGFDAGRLRDDLALPQVVSEEQIAQALDRKPQLPSPFRLGVVFRDAPERPYPVQDPWSWSGANKDRLLAALSILVERGIVSEVVVVSQATVPGDDLLSLRLAAARHGADALLAVSATAVTDVSLNGWSVLYLTLVAAWFVPGTEVTVSVATNGTLWDVRNEYLYASVEAEASAHDAVAAFLRHDRGLVDQASAEALVRLGDSLLARITASDQGAPR